MKYSKNRQQDFDVENYIERIEKVIDLRNLMDYNFVENMLAQIWEDGYDFGFTEGPVKDETEKAYNEGYKDGYTNGRATNQD